MSGHDSLTRDKILCYLIIVCFLGAFYTFSWGGTFCFYQRIGGRKRINERRKRRSSMHCLQLLCFYNCREGARERLCWSGKEWTGKDRTESILFEHGRYLVLPSLSLCGFSFLLLSNSHNNCSSGFLKELRHRRAHERGRCCIRETCVGSIS